jgi:hypothetical protein
MIKVKYFSNLLIFRVLIFCVIDFFYFSFANNENYLIKDYFISQLT